MLEITSIYNVCCRDGEGAMEMAGDSDDGDVLPGQYDFYALTKYDRETCEI